MKRTRLVCSMAFVIIAGLALFAWPALTVDKSNIILILSGDPGRIRSYPAFSTGTIMAAVACRGSVWRSRQRPCRRTPGTWRKGR